MRHTEKFIQDAIEGGWFLNFYTGKSLWNKGRPWKLKKAIRPMVLEKVMLDPLAWQAVGKVRGWKEVKYPRSGDFSYFGTWLQYMHGLIYALADGKTIEYYLATI